MSAEAREAFGDRVLMASMMAVNRRSRRRISSALIVIVFAWPLMRSRPLIFADELLQYREQDRRDRELDGFRRPLAQQQRVLLLHVCWMIASSSSSSSMRMPADVTMPPSEMTPTLAVPPPMSTTMVLPAGSWMGSPAPIAWPPSALDDVRGAMKMAATFASDRRCAAPPRWMPDGTQTTTRGFARSRRLCESSG